MAGAIGLLIQVSVPLGLLMLGFLVGRQRERKHLRDLAVREAEFAGMLLSDLKTVPPEWGVAEGFLVTGSVVIATDYFKAFLGALRNLFGGRIRAYEVLLDRARREALLRMQAEARSRSAAVVWNIRLETATLQGRGRAGGVEVIAYGTALRLG